MPARLFVFWALLACAALFEVQSFELTILHVNDIHVRISETNARSSTCKPEHKGNCFGGVARLFAAVQDITETEENVLFLNAGDMFQGTSWYTFFKWEATAKFMNILNFTASALGNHEFDDKVEGFAPFAKAATFPMVCANCDFSSFPDVAPIVKPYLVVTVGDIRIGIIGYLTPNTTFLSSAAGVKFGDEITSIQKYADQLGSEGVNIIIALGHSGYEPDQVIAKQVRGLDLVVGGHSHSFLLPKDAIRSQFDENPVGDYPTMVSSEAEPGKVVPVLQAFAFTKYLGRTKLKFDDNGNLQSWDGAPILLDNKFRQDQGVLEQMKPYEVMIQQRGSEVLGSSNFDFSNTIIDGDSSMGNLITDAMVEWYTSRSPVEAPPKSIVSIAICNTGGIRASFSKGNITREDLIAVIPFSNTYDLITVTGDTLMGMMELSVSAFEPEQEFKTRFRGYLVTSGLLAVVDISKPKGNRLISLKTRCSRCGSSAALDVLPKAQYQMVVPSYLLSGGDNYGQIFDGKITSRRQGPLDADVMEEYIVRHSPLEPSEISDRISIIKATNTANSVSSLNWVLGLCMVLLMHSHR